MKQTLNCIPRTFKRVKLSKYITIDIAHLIDGRIIWKTKKFRRII